ncbi:MAG: hypothetical protein HY054_09715 [Proteobacteria bacterium]|nr:hypothetical protein [Pseudomonadota bacterium]
MTEAIAALQKSLAEAGHSLVGGDAADAERRARAITALVRAQRDVAEFAAASSAVENDDEDLCADLRRRLVEFAQADLAGAPPEVLERIATESLRR